MNYAEAINDAMIIAMSKDKKVICYGLGVDDPKRIFGTTQHLKERFGPDRIFDVPTSENALVGIGTGLAIGGYKPIFVSQRFDFILLAIDQIVNSAAKWYHMFGSKSHIPLVLRLIVGRGWGQGPTHSQSFHSWFANVPGLKVVIPSNAIDAKGLLLSSIFDKNPIIFVEHRWLYNLEEDVPKGDYRTQIGKANLIQKGKDITIISNSFMTIEARHAIKHLKKQNISCELIDLHTVRPIDWDTIYKSVNKTGRLIAIDTGSHNLSIASEIISMVIDKCWTKLKNKPIKIGMPDQIQPTSFALTKNFYPNYITIVKEVSKLINFNLDLKSIEKKQESKHDIPGPWFKGPF
tara:strand:+ start:12 stop:1058 length:1047 start_codon:yes stop_codon:yes gene_type:complete